MNRKNWLTVYCGGPPSSISTAVVVATCAFSVENQELWHCRRSHIKTKCPSSQSKGSEGIGFNCQSTGHRLTFPARDIAAAQVLQGIYPLFGEAESYGGYC